MWKKFRKKKYTFGNNSTETKRVLSVLSEIQNILNLWRGIDVYRKNIVFLKEHNGEMRFKWISSEREKITKTARLY